MNSDYTNPVNIGNTEELTIQEFAEKIRGMVGNNNKIVHLDAVVDDPRQRRPNIDVAFRELGWRPKVKSFCLIIIKYWQVSHHFK